MTGNHEALRLLVQLEDALTADPRDAMSYDSAVYIYVQALKVEDVTGGVLMLLNQAGFALASTDGWRPLTHEIGMTAALELKRQEVTA